MRLVTFLAGCGTPHLGVVAGEQVVPIDGYTDMNSLLSAGSSVLADAERNDGGEQSAKTKYSLSGVTLLAPVTRPGKITAAGLNYRDHARETKQPIPTTPIIFAKFPSSINGPEGAVVLPGDDPQEDYEAELAVVIGRRAKAVSESDALNHVAGYMPLNDVSARR